MPLRLTKQGISVVRQHPLKVYDEDDYILGDYLADVFVDSRLIVEVKACKALADEHTAQLLGYLQAARIEHGLLVNFGVPKFQIKMYARSIPDDTRG